MLPTPSLAPPDRMIARTLNALLDREPWARERLARHAGKTVRFAAAGFTLNLTIASDGSTDPADSAIVPDVTLTVRTAGFSPLQWAGQRMLALADGRASGSHDAVTEMTHIEGDAGLAQVVGELAQQLRFDPEDELARVIGDIPALRILGAARGLAEGVRRAGSRVLGNLAEYLSEERGAITAQPSMAQWRADAAELDVRARGLAARAAQLQARVSRLAADRS